MNTWKSTKNLLLLAIAATASTSVAAFDTHVIGGYDVDIEAVPSTVALINVDTLNQTASLYQSQQCGGTIIGDRWVLTAAHCVESRSGVIMQPEDLMVLMGTSDLNNAASDPVAVSRIIQHEDWNSATIKNDIALLELASRASHPAIRLDTQAPQMQDDAFIAGWGAESIDANGAPTSYPSHLQGVYVDITPGDVCPDMYPAYEGVLDKTQMCVGVPEGGKSSCFGDSGGPAYRVTEEQTLILAGVTSFGIICADAETPGVYVSVFAYRDWILSYIGEESQQVEPEDENNDDQQTNNGSRDEVNPVGAGASFMFIPLLLAIALRRSRKFLALLTVASVVATTGQAQANDDDFVGLIGGDELDIVFVPSIVALLDRRAFTANGNYSRAQFCGGTLIGDRWVLTAAHCVADENPTITADDLMVLMGQSEIDNTGEPVSVDRIIIHPQWDTRQIDFDLALLELSFTASQPAIAMDFQPVTFDDQGYIAGWGTEEVDSSNGVVRYGTALRGAYVPLTPGNECNDRFSGLPGQIRTNTFCAGGIEDDLGGCFGDSGGPAYRVTEEYGLVLSGVASYITGLCGQVRRPTVYVSTWDFRDWIIGEVGSQNLAVLPTQNSGGGSGGGGAAWFMLPLLFIARLARAKRLRLVVMASVATGLLSACLSAKTLNAGDNQGVEEGDMSISVFEQPIGQMRDDVFDSIGELWASTPSCTVDRTGVGKLMKAYFLESCEYANTAEQTVCGFKPASAQYYYLERQLIRVSFNFDETDTTGYRECVLSKGWELGFNQVAIVDSNEEQEDGVLRLTGPEPTFGIMIGENDLTHVSNVEVVSTIHAMKGTL